MIKMRKRRQMLKSTEMKKMMEIMHSRSKRMMRKYKKRESWSWMI